MDEDCIPQAKPKSCEECRRRKSKCDKKYPSCLPCKRDGRACVYKPRNNSSTKRQLADAQSELAQAKRRLRTLEGRTRESPGHEDQLDRDHSVATIHGLETVNDDDKSADNAASWVGRESIGIGSAVTSDGRAPLEQASAPELSVSTLIPRTQSTCQPQDVASQASGFSNQSSLGHVLLDSPEAGHPATILSMDNGHGPKDYDWDEGGRRMGGRAIGQGMANLPDDTKGSGYLGIASGAALLRMASGPEREPIVDETARNTPEPTPPAQDMSFSALESFIDGYFAVFHKSYPIVHEPTFRAQFMEVVPRPSGNAWFVLLYIMAAIGASSAAYESTDHDLNLYKAAKAWLTFDLLETGNLTLVQALTLMANYVQKRGKPNTGYSYSGLARRVAMGIGLHKELTNSDLSPLQLEMRRRVWWCHYVFDVGGIITFSRPFDFPIQGVETQLPANIHDLSLTAMSKQVPPSMEESTLYSHIRAQCTFHLATHGIYSRIISNPYPPARELIQLDDSHIGGWLESLPSYYRESCQQPDKLRLAHAIMSWRYRNFRLLMYRPYLVRRYITRLDDNNGVSDPEAAKYYAMTVDRCIVAAKESVALISNYWMSSPKTMMAAWYGLYFLFQAVLISVICLRNDPHGEFAPICRQMISQAVETFDSMAVANPLAKRYNEVLESLGGSYLFARGNDLLKPTEESPQTQLNSLYPMMWPMLDTIETGSNDFIWQESTIAEFIGQVRGFGEDEVDFTCL